MKTKTLDILLIIFSFLIAISFPFALFDLDQNIILLLSDALKIIDIIFIYFYVSKTKIDYKDKKKSIFSGLVFFLCFPILLYNLAYGLFTSSIGFIDFTINVPITYFSTLLSVILEEVVFRQIVYQNIKTKNLLLNILLSSLIFSLCHIVNFIGSFNVLAMLETLAYTFCLGIILAMAYERSGYIIIPIILHFLYNILNNDAFLYTFDMSNIKYIIAAIICGILSLGGTYLAWVITNKKKSKYELVKRK